MKETELKIRIYGDPVLRKRSSQLVSVKDEHRQILSEMARLMYDFSGIGLAGPQVGINKSLIVVDIGTGLFKLVNPKIIKRSGKQAIEEGCLSLPGVCIKVRRAGAIRVKALDENGKEIILEAEDLLACVIQHEMDHLRGKLIVDHASILDKIKIKNKLSKLSQRSKDERLSEHKTESCKLQL
jgi:peptide deformylase